jgi:hypothetical protein
LLELPYYYPEVLGIDVHLYASIVCDGCLECARTILNVLASKRHQNPARIGYADSAITKESNLIIYPNLSLLLPNPGKSG